MAFGTGHHETTSSILGELLDTDLKGKSVLDMGCGTSILAILASMRGADPVTAIDIDDWCVNNSRDNIALNHINNITVELGMLPCLKDASHSMSLSRYQPKYPAKRSSGLYTACMHSGSEIYMSGFYVEDIPAIRERGESLGLEFVHYRKSTTGLQSSFIVNKIYSYYVTLKAAFHTGSGSLFHIRVFSSARKGLFFKYL